MKETLLAISSLIISFTSVFISYISYRQKYNINNQKKENQKGELISDIRYIKASVDRLEKSITKIDDSYHELEIRVTKLEEKIRKDEGN